MTAVLFLAVARPLPRTAASLAAIAVAVAIRVAANGSSPSSALAAGAAFGLGLTAIAVAGGWRVRRPAASSIGGGLLGGALLVGVAIALHPVRAIGIRPEPMLGWAAVTVLVAVGEELALRGVLLDAVRAAVGPAAAVAVTSLAFALIHVPLYGLSVVPLDLGVGVLFAGLRLATGSVAAPALAHVVADLATGWL